MPKFWYSCCQPLMRRPKHTQNIASCPKIITEIQSHKQVKRSPIMSSVCGELPTSSVFFGLVWVYK